MHFGQNITLGPVELLRQTWPRDVALIVFFPTRYTFDVRNVSCFFSLGISGTFKFVRRQ